MNNSVSAAGRVCMVTSVVLMYATFYLKELSRLSGLTFTPSDYEPPLVLWLIPILLFLVGLVLLGASFIRNQK